MFRIWLILIGWLLHAYVFWHLATTPGVRERCSRRTLAWICGAVAMAFALALLAGRTGKSWSVFPGLAALTWETTLLLVALCLLPLDLASALRPLRPLARKLRVPAFGAGLCLTGFALYQGTRPPVVESQEISVQGLPSERDRTTILVASDFHVGPVLDAGWLSERVNQIQALHPDVIVLLGDLFDGQNPPPAGTGAVLGGLRAPGGVWAVPGNHDRQEGLECLQRAGIHVLDDEWGEVYPGLSLVGIGYRTSQMRTEEDRRRLETLLSRQPPGARLMLSHTSTPSPLAARAGMGALLAGHTHGGQVFPVGLLLRLFNRMVDGLYCEGNLPVLVTRGAGTWGPRMRLWAPAGMVTLTLRAPGHLESAPARQDLPGRNLPRQP